MGIVTLEPRQLESVIARASAPLFSCRFGEDRSPILAKEFASAYLAGGIDRFDRLLTAVADKKGMHYHGTDYSRRETMGLFDQVEAQLRATDILILILSNREREKYPLAVNMIATLIQQDVMHLQLLSWNGLGHRQRS